MFDVRKSEIISLAKKIKNDKVAREKAILYASTAVNYFFVIFQLYGGIRYRSAWFIALGVYYAVLTSATLYVGLSKNKSGPEAWKVFRTSGWALTVANLALIVMISVMVAVPSIAIHGYSTAMAVIVTIWTFYLLISAVVGIVKHWKRRDVIAIAENGLQLIGAAVSVLMLQTAMIASYSTQVIEKAERALSRVSDVVGTPTEVNDVVNTMIQTFVVSNRITGIMVAIMVLTITIYMITKGTKEYKREKAK